MTETLIKCVCPEYQISDLNLKVYAGQVVWVDEEKAKNSADLRHAILIKAVQVQWGARSSVAPPTTRPVPPWLARRGRNFQPNIRVVEVPAPPSAQDAPFPPPITEEIIRSVVREEIRQAIHAQGGGQNNIDSLVEAVRTLQLMSHGTSVAPTTYAPVVSSSEPVFIPSGLVPTDSGTTISVSAETSSNSGVEDAAAALKAARGRKKKE